MACLRKLPATWGGWPAWQGQGLGHAYFQAWCPAVKIRILPVLLKGYWVTVSCCMDRAPLASGMEAGWGEE